MTFASAGGGGHHGLRKFSRNPVYRYVNLPCCVKRAVSRSLCDVVEIDLAGTVKMALRVTGAYNVYYVKSCDAHKVIELSPH